MTARPSHTDVSEAAKLKKSSRNSSENTDASADDSADFHDACVIAGAHNSRSGVELSCLAPTADEGNAQRCKKSSFQITRVVQAEAAGDDADDVTSTEDLGSSLEGKKNTNTELDAQSIDTTQSPSSVEDPESSSSCQRHLLPNPSKLAVRTRPSDINSRFKIVKIESNKPQRRGRWVCLEFLDPPQISEPQEKTVKHDNVESAGSLITSPIYYIQMEKEDPSNDKFAAAIVYSDGHLSLEPNPLPFADSAARPSPCSIASDTFVLPPAIQLSDNCAATSSSKEISSLSLESNNRESEPMTRSSDQHAHLSAVRQHSRRVEGDRLLLANGVSNDELINNIRNDDQNFAVLRTGSDPLFVHSMVSESGSSPFFAIVPSSANVYDFAENDASSGEICGLDNKIEQAMDLVKNHLMYAVHEEVELLKEQIKELTIKKGHLEYENRVLRASATQETLEKLHDVIASQPILTIINN